MHEEVVTAHADHAYICDDGEAGASSGSVTTVTRSIEPAGPIAKSPLDIASVRGCPLTTTVTCVVAEDDEVALTLIVTIYVVDAANVYGGITNDGVRELEIPERSNGILLESLASATAVHKYVNGPTRTELQSK